MQHFIVSLSILIYMLPMVCHVQAQSPSESTWQPMVEARLKAIYELGEYRPQKFAARWFPDSSGYTVDERDPDTDALINASYDVRTGQRVESKALEQDADQSQSLRSPDGQHVLVYVDRDLFLRDLATTQQTLIAQRPPERDVRFHRPTWSPDGKRVLFVEADATNVCERAVIVPDDPSYPGVQHHRFASWRNN